MVVSRIRLRHFTIKNNFILNLKKLLLHHHHHISHGIIQTLEYISIFLKKLHFSLKSIFYYPGISEIMRFFKDFEIVFFESFLPVVETPEAKSLVHFRIPIVSVILFT
ncbi:TPA: hypothetical protein DEG21_02175 [Patescibacteria group bacterium]|nr:hypothetical protein [Candidatus Gracilibacteria bacterium]